MSTLLSDEARWRSMDTAPKGLPGDSVGCRYASDWFIGRVAEARRGPGTPPYIIIQRRGWPNDEGWRCGGDANYVSDYFDAWMPLATFLERAAAQQGVTVTEEMVERGAQAMLKSAAWSSFWSLDDSRILVRAALEAALRTPPSSEKVE